MVFYTESPVVWRVSPYAKRSDNYHVGVSIVVMTRSHQTTVLNSIPFPVYPIIIHRHPKSQR
jgi:hypothetical protein